MIRANARQLSRASERPLRKVIQQLSEKLRLLPAVQEALSTPSDSQMQYQTIEQPVPIHIPLPIKWRNRTFRCLHTTSSSPKSMRPSFEEAQAEWLGKNKDPLHAASSRTLGKGIIECWVQDDFDGAERELRKSYQEPLFRASSHSSVLCYYDSPDFDFVEGDDDFEFDNGIAQEDDWITEDEAYL